MGLLINDVIQICDNICTHTHFPSPQNWYDHSECIIGGNIVVHHSKIERGHPQKLQKVSMRLYLDTVVDKCLCELLRLQDGLQGGLAGVPLRDYCTQHLEEGGMVSIKGRGA